MKYPWLLSLAALGVFLPASVFGATCPLETEMAYKKSPSPSVWYVTKDCTKKGFHNEKLYKSYFDSWDAVQETNEVLYTIPSDDIPWMGWGPKYDPQYGAVVKTLDDPKVYFLLGGKKYWIDSEDSFKDLGYKWSWVEDVDQRLLDKYPAGGQISSVDYQPNYSLVKKAGDPKVYRIEPRNGEDGGSRVLRHITSEAVFKSLGYRFDRVIEITDDMFFSPFKRFFIGDPIESVDDVGSMTDSKGEESKSPSEFTLKSWSENYQKSGSGVGGDNPFLTFREKNTTEYFGLNITRVSGLEPVYNAQDVLDGYNGMKEVELPEDFTFGDLITFSLLQQEAFREALSSQDDVEIDFEDGTITDAEYIFSILSNLYLFQEAEPFVGALMSGNNNVAIFEGTRTDERAVSDEDTIKYSVDGWVFDDTGLYYVQAGYNKGTEVDAQVLLEVREKTEAFIASLEF